MTTQAEVISWLKQPDHIRIILVEVQGIVEVPGGTLYLSNKPYTSTSSDTPASTYYEACITGGISFSESIDLEGAPTIGYGDLEIDNTAGVRDAWLNYVWANKYVNIYIGDPRWARNNFYQIFSGLVTDIASRDLNRLNIILLNKLERLNRPIYETVLGGSGQNADRVKPLLFGECFNVEPLLTDSVPNTLQYMVHDGNIEDIIEVRDNGVPVSITKTLASGTFNLVRSPAGQITASVQGCKPTTYLTKIPELIQHIVTTYGPSNTRFSISDIDTTNFTSYNTTYTQPVGIYCKDRENILDVCNRLASSIGGALTVSSSGLLKLTRLTVPTSNGVTWNIGAEDVEVDSFYISDKPPVKGAIKIAYCKNWTPQNSGLATGLPSVDVPVFEKDWYYSDATDGTTLSTYKLTDEPIAEETMLITTTTANTEATRRLALWSTPRYIVSLTCYAHMLPVELGDGVNMTHFRYAYTGGKTGTIISIERDWIAGRVVLGVLV